MKLHVSEHLAETDAAAIVDGIREYNHRFTPDDHRPLSVVGRDDDGEIVAGLTGKTFWNYLFVNLLWVDAAHRGEGFGTQLLVAAEEEAVRRGCRYVVLDTYSFQALPFYEGMGYEVFGSIDGFAGSHERHYLRKVLRAE